ncbi:MAG: beta-ketoacyl-[acyl-carrier-protein] synthase family protein [Planctomycetia bacterium]|uniref:Ketosynthase family 3 (KS3) domain-containing protein n=1 Tax=Candidatus Brocadia sapporoensis TaxID=392547 RepID=A0A1V6M0F3_9BACT|nr:beta-ketoacyl-[acyl-carrier-protein] synthase family protein [Candidatus Brocadia sapporoensis]MCC7239830.1 beta-ketoacyl-[acyl-carrier-protein] synthase family protein [Candidatus Brocadia sp.]QOJ06475.1 MAG: beta-ketoacyl-[acyl-carrier-protein] synthase family protein [Planctomycetia bacterium]TVL95680.1 MAG: beta-ketoacyl-[acyl-carrier-protein] synthase family protein [Candidatus Brocadia sp. BL1]MDG6005609.1 beta-ketoacyl-[acyl-carrier-protein] synthase family protein [Candidatus Brocadi
MNKQVVITGVGMITPIGSGKERFWSSLIAGVSGVDDVTCIDTSGYKVHKGCEVKNFRYSDYIKNGVLKKIGKGSQFAIAATRLALDDARLDLSKVALERIGVSVGTTAGEIQILEKVNYIRHKDGEDKVDPDLFLMHPCNNIPANVAIEFGFKGPNTIIPTACAAGNYAIGYAYDLIKFGRVDMMVAGGSDPFSKVAYTGFARLGAIAPEICQPFDKNRKGMMVGEGSGMLLLESLDHAVKRNANVYAEIIGYGLSCDAYHITIPHPDGEGVVSAMKKALKSAHLQPEDVQYVSAHGTGTPANDKAETISIKKVFGNRPEHLAISSIKSMIGHTMGAASAIEAITCALVVQNDIIPPTINYETPDPECDLDYVPNIARKQKVAIALNNAHAFGGNNSCLVVKKFTGKT